MSGPLHRSHHLALLLLMFTCCCAAAPAAPATTRPAMPPLPPAFDGPLAHVRHVVFATRTPNDDPHWYANFGYWSEDFSRKMYSKGGSRLCRLDLRTGQVTNLIDDPAGTIRDPQIHYDARKILFSYRKADRQHFNLYEIDIDGANLRQITDGPWDDIEPTYLPNGDIVFCSSRCKRWVNCWFTQVAIMFRCDADGRNLRPVSANTEHDNTPSVLPDGRLLYTRWEYVDRSQVEFHHLWTANPDGTNPQTFFGNLHPGGLFIDAKPLPDSRKVLAIFSPGHGVKEHNGTLTIVNPEPGPDDRSAAVAVKGCPPMVRDPFPIDGNFLLVARRNEIHLVDAAAGKSHVLYADKQELHEPNAIVPRRREAIIPDRTRLAEPTGRLILADAHIGRNMDGVAPGEIKKLLVLESLPKPINFSGGPEPLTSLGTFTLERVVGTVPVEPDGSAHIELPANRQFFFVALDKHDRSIKRMQSWVSVMPGETTGCVGCHEQRTQTAPVRSTLQALRRPASRIEPFADLPDVVDFPRDVQPILDEHCVKCHSYEKPDGGTILTGDRGPVYSHSHWMLIYGNQVADGRNGYGNRAPRSIGSSASKLMDKIDGAHYGAKLSPRQQRLIWMWIESGATYPGTYAALGSGMVGVPLLKDPDDEGPAKAPAADLLERRCYACHAAPNDKPALAAGKIALPALRPARKPGDAAYERRVIDNDPMRRRANEILFNLTRPEKSILLLAPLAKSAGGWQSCGAEVFKDTQDPDYQRLLAVIRRSADRLNQVKRFDMPGYRPNAHYVREMKRYGILPANFDLAKDPIDVYQTDRAYWESLWWRPSLAVR